jgi:hypothetical protein
MQRQITGPVLIRPSSCLTQILWAFHFPARHQRSIHLLVAQRLLRITTVSFRIPMSIFLLHFSFFMPWHPNSMGLHLRILPPPVGRRRR